MSVRDRLRKKTTAPEAAFQLPTPTHEAFHSVSAFERALKGRKESMVLLAGGILEEGLDARGRVVHAREGDIQLTRDAFNDLCSLTRMPSSWIRGRVEKNEELALSMIRDVLRTELPTNSVTLIMDGTRMEVDAIVPGQVTDVLHPADLFDWAMSANPDLEFTRGVTEGARCRLTLADPTRPVEPQVGDVVRFGTSLITDLRGADALVVTDYNERLKCSNGMVSVEKSAARIIEQDSSDLVGESQEAVLASVERSRAMAPYMRDAAKAYFDTDGIKIAQAIVRKGGGDGLVAEVVTNAMKEAQWAGRTAGDLTLWDMVNGVTQVARDAPHLQRRTALEGLGYQLMTEFFATGAN